MHLRLEYTYFLLTFPFFPGILLHLRACRHDEHGDLCEGILEISCDTSLYWFSCLQACGSNRTAFFRIQGLTATSYALHPRRDPIPSRHIPHAELHTSSTPARPARRGLHFRSRAPPPARVRLRGRRTPCVFDRLHSYQTHRLPGTVMAFEFFLHYPPVRVRDGIHEPRICAAVRRFGTAQIGRA